MSIKTTYDIPTFNFELFQKRMARQSKRAVKLGFSELDYEDHGLKSISVQGRNVVVHQITVSGDRPFIKGWEFIGVLSHEKGMPDPLIHSLSKLNPIPNQYKTCEPNCDHCQVNRARNKTFIIKESHSGKTKQIGSGCINDFFGGQNPNAIATYAELYGDLHYYFNLLQTDFDCLNDYAADYLDVKDVLERSAATIYLYGYVSSTDANLMDEISTVDRVKASFMVNAIPSQHINVTPDDKQVAADVYEWINSDYLKNERMTSEYFYNLNTITNFGQVSLKKAGIIVSAVKSYHQYLEKLRVQACLDQSCYLGEKGQRLEHIEAQLLGKHHFQNDFGGKTLNRFVDNDNNLINWFNTGAEIVCLPGESFHLTGSIDKHQEYKGAKQTLLKRVVIHEDKIIHAVSNGDLKTLEKLLKKPSFLNIHHCSNYQTPLMIACKMGNSDCVELLLKAGADPRHATRDGHAGFFTVYPTQNNTYDAVFENKLLNCTQKLLEFAPDIMDIPLADGRLMADIANESMKNGMEGLLLKQLIADNDADDTFMSM